MFLDTNLQKWLGLINYVSFRLVRRVTKIMPINTVIRAPVEILKLRTVSKNIPPQTSFTSELARVS